MISAFVIDLLMFKPLMLSRAISVYGPFPWPGTNILYHFLLDVGVVTLGALNMYLGFRFGARKDGKMFMPPKGRSHRAVGWAFLVAWIAAFVLGVQLFVWAHVP